MRASVPSVARSQQMCGGRDELDDLLDRDLDSHRKGSRKHLWWTQVGQATQAALASRVADEPFTDGSHMEEGQLCSLV